MDSDFSIKEDPRYQALELKISEFQLMRQNDVWDALQSLIFFNNYVSQNQLERLENTLKIRPTIPFNLKCETEGRRKSEILDLAQNQISGNTEGSGEAIMGLGIGLAVASGVLTILSVCCLNARSDGSCGFCLMFVNFVVGLSLTISVTVVGYNYAGDLKFKVLDN